MNNVELIAFASMLIALASLIGTVVMYAVQRRSSRIAEITRLHELWWGTELDGARKKIFPFIEEWNGGGGTITPIIRSYRGRSSEFEVERRMIGRIAFFFADLNAMIDAGLVHEGFAYRVFGEAQFFWFSPFLLAVANEVEPAHRAGSTSTGSVVRWIPEVRGLEQRFRRLQKSGRRTL